MGKYTSTRAFQRDRERTHSSQSNTFNSVPEYFLEVPQTETQFHVQSFLYGVDPTGLYKGSLEYRDVTNYWNDYFANTGLTWSDVKYPTKMYGYGIGGSTASRGINYVSRNLKRLYS